MSIIENAELVEISIDKDGRVDINADGNKIISVGKTKMVIAETMSASLFSTNRQVLHELVE